MSELGGFKRLNSGAEKEPVAIKAVQIHDLHYIPQHGADYLSVLKTMDLVSHDENEYDAILGYD